MNHIRRRRFLNVRWMDYFRRRVKCLNIPDPQDEAIIFDRCRDVAISGGRLGLRIDPFAMSDYVVGLGWQG